MSRPIPTINTARLRLRGMRVEEFERYAEIWREPEVVAYISSQPKSRAKSWDAFLRNAGQWQMSGFGQWAIQRHESAQMMGQTGFFNGGRELGDDFDWYPEAGWVLDPSAHGTGFALEAVQAAHDWFDRVISGRTVCVISPDNEPSMKLAHKLGYRVLRDAQMDGSAVQLMTRKGPVLAGS